ncbi:hypothetical protein DRQ25_05300 [Candidatus Fermentibacteria bacterium]|nr:MAG: hypothetical protein DRQ25_05300 [Candidatus Fermentibacteria bacterium]
MIELKHRDEQIELGKRTYVPCTLTATCPRCGGVASKDFGKAYLSYPCTNSPFECSVWCESCDEPVEVKVKLVLRLRLELA